jgi:uridine kinase
MTEQRVVIGICGASGTGKTTLANTLHHHFCCTKKNKDVRHIVRCDLCFKSRNAPMTEFGRNMEVPEAIDYGKIVQLIQESTQTITFVEGFLLFSSHLALPYINIKIYLESEKEVCYQRRFSRKPRKDEKKFREHYDKYVWPCHVENNKHIKEIDDVFVVDCRVSPEEVAKLCIAYISQKLTEIGIN